jgi:hypothetical protein
MTDDANNGDYAVPDGARMGRIAGYRKMSEAELGIFEDIKQTEERVLRYVDSLKAFPDFDHRWIAIAVTHYQQGTMALLRAVARPGRIPLPEDDVKLDTAADADFERGGTGGYTPQQGG